MKDHPFTDGNKRIGSLLFLLYLRQEGLHHDLNPQALTALTLLIAESAPANKDLLVRLIVNLLRGRRDELLIAWEVQPIHGGCSAHVNGCSGHGRVCFAHPGA